MILEDQFSLPLLAWYDIHGRKDLPWQLPREPYPVWISEIMLQQTQVQTVIPYFNRFMARFPTVAALAEANEDDVLSLWSGLGYYSRARNIHRTAKLIHDNYTGCFPTDLPRLIELPGIGPSTAAAILSQAHNLPTAILDGNVKRVLARFFLVDGPTEQAAVKKKLWELADACMHQERCADYTQAIMDLGATC
ncbi:MAG: A/G-specific adenine glycosylase, partial [Legionella sp.]